LAEELNLSCAGLIETRRDGGGGAMLAKPPETFRLNQIFRLLGEDQPLGECFSKANDSGRAGWRQPPPKRRLSELCGIRRETYQS
jgi:DNA-binding IscR family transcriptional regulator